MASPKEVLMKAKSGIAAGTMNELISRVFTTRNLAHFFHWKTGSLAAHMASGDLYEDIVGKMDDIVECFQGKFGLLDSVHTMSASTPSDIVAHVKEEAEWVEHNKASIAQGCDIIMNMLDELGSMYLKTIYKLENLK